MNGNRHNPLAALWRKLVRFGFRLLYNEFAFTYDLVSKAVSLGAWHCWQRAALKYLDVEPGVKVLELAYGTGNLHLDLHAAGYSVFGHDLSANMGAITRRKLRRAGLTARLSRGLAQQLPYASASFDAVVSTFPTDFILAPETLREVARVLKPSGSFIIVPNGILTSKGAVANSVEWLYRITGQRDPGSPADELSNFFDGYGFNARMLHEDCPKSIASVIVAQKQ